MKLTVDQDLCIACGSCIDVCPEVFNWNDEGLAHTITDAVSTDQEENAKEALELCPTDAIKEV